MLVLHVAFFKEFKHISFVFKRFFLLATSHYFQIFKRVEIKKTFYDVNCIFDISILSIYQKITKASVMLRPFKIVTETYLMLVSV